MTPSARLKMLNFIFIFCILNSDYRSSSATSPRLHHHHHHRLERSSHRSSGHHHGHHHQLQHHNTWGGGGDMLQAATFALQASAFTSMSHSSSASGGSDHSSALPVSNSNFLSRPLQIPVIFLIVLRVALAMLTRLHQIQTIPIYA